MMGNKLKKIKILAMDVDGTMTDGSIYISAQGESMKQFNVRDGLGISLLHQAGILVAVITGRTSDIVLERARELRIKEVMQGIADKCAAIQVLADKYEVSPDEIAYIGDDVNDLPALLVSGVAVCPADAEELVKDKCHVVLEHCGGRGAIRELAEMILKEQGKLQQVLEDLYALRQ